MKKTIGLILGAILFLSGVATAQTNCWTFNSVTASWVNSCTGTVTPPILAVTGKQLTLYNSLGIKATDNQIIDFSGLPNGSNKLGSAALASTTAFQPSGAAINLIGVDNSTTITNGTSTSCSVGQFQWTQLTSTGLGFTTGMIVTAYVTASPNVYMVGSVCSYSGTQITIASNYAVGSYTGSGWSIQIGGNIGPTGATGSGSNPVGTIIAFGGSSTPTNHLPCDGTQYACSSYPSLCTALGNTWGGNGSTTFNVPDLRGRFPLGAGQGATEYNGGTGTNRVLGKLSNGDPSYGATIVGSETHTLTSSEIPANIPYTDSGHSHGVSGNFLTQSGSAYGLAAGSSYLNPGVATITNPVVTGITINPSGGGAHNQMNPFAVVNYYIRYQ